MYQCVLVINLGPLRGPTRSACRGPAGRAGLRYAGQWRASSDMGRFAPIPPTPWPELFAPMGPRFGPQKACHEFNSAIGNSTGRNYSRACISVSSRVDVFKIGSRIPFRLLGTTSAQKSEKPGSVEPAGLLWNRDLERKRRSRGPLADSRPGPLSA